MSRKIEITTNEKTYFIEALKNGIRLNGRQFNEMRTPSNIFLSKDEYGYIELEWGLTKISCRVSSFIRKPFEDRPFEGIFNINCEINSMASKQFENGKNSDEEVLISRIIEKSIRRSNSLDLESLCIISGEKVWSITVDLNFLNFDGNFIDIGCFGVMLALSHFKKPDITIINGGKDIIIHDINEREPQPLSILHIPICLTYSFYNTSQNVEENIKGESDEDAIYLLDCDYKEDLLKDGSIIITLNKNREIIQLSKNGGIPIDVNILLDLSLNSIKFVNELTDLIKTLIKDHEQQRFTELNLKLLQVGADR
ncbi:ribosomal protein S5 domain 2-type protein [Scheffersomyces coipomensis]|uniref:ribosomal protein S5 domain 2-type protein n=1 Tax=Scheffersomyces coipomensis TaxID=1788519 RepID=UPI00315CB1EA